MNTNPITTLESVRAARATAAAKLETAAEGLASLMAQASDALGSRGTDPKKVAAALRRAADEAEASADGYARRAGEILADLREKLK